MTFKEILAQVLEQLQSEGRVSYRALKRQFALDDEYLEDLKAEIIDAKRLAVDEDGKVLVWREHSGTLQTPDSGPRTLDFPGLRTSDPGRWTPPHLAERILAEREAMAARRIPDGERKTITALFADLKGSTALIEGLDPEDARALIDPALQLMMDAVHRYEGYVAQALGDGIFALFGAPLAHEDHPQRALYAALRMQEEMRRYSDQLRRAGRVPVQLRVGVNTGEVVVRSIHKEDLHTDYVPIGLSTNLAARMEQLANPGSILVTADTYKLTEGYFEFTPLGATTVKGVEEPLNIYEVLGAGPLRTRLQIAAKRGLSRFVGRQREMEQLKQALAQAKAGQGQIVGVMGEPGMGKSRLFHEFVGAVREPPLRSHAGSVVLTAYSVSYGKASAYLPVIELLKSYFHLQPQDDERQRQEKITGKVLTLDRSLEDTLPYLFALLGIEAPTSSLQQMDPQIRRQRTFEALKRLFLRESLKQPLMLIFEDLHWIDNETQGFLDVLAESVATARILLLINYRPEYRHEWGAKTYYTQVRLAPLGKEDADALLSFLLGTDLTLKTLKQLILEKTEGTPFFVEEVVQMLVEQGALAGERGNYRVERTPTALHISPTVQGVLAARIDRLGTAEKELLQQLAVIGREFSLSLVRWVVTQPEEELYQLLSRLQSKEFLYEQLAFPEVEYSFKHALTQEVAYGSVLQERRKALHEQTAQAIEDLYCTNLEDHYNELAHHYSRSGNTQKAVEYLHKAGQQAVQRSANMEAINHLNTALELVKTLPDSCERTQQELSLHVALGVPLMITKGTTAPEVERVYTRARELCQQVGESPQLFPVLWGLRLFYTNRGELQTAQQLGEQLLRVAQSRQDLVLLSQAHRALGGALFYLGEFAAAREHLQQGSVLYDSLQHRSYVLLYGQDPGVTCLSGVAAALWYLGYPDQARKSIHKALTLAQQLSHPYSLAFALTYVGHLHQLRGEAHLAQEQAEALITLSNEHGFAEVLAMGVTLRGWALAAQGQVEEGIGQIHQGLVAYQAIKIELWRWYDVALLAEVYGKGGRAEEGLSVLAEALTVVNKTERRWYEAELYRLKGTLTLQSQASLRQVNASQNKSEIPSTQHLAPNTQAEAEVEPCFLKAIEIARKQQAKSLELRAVMSLARLWQQQGKKDEARQMLTEIYGWFTEGFDTQDLQEAKLLLQELA